MSEGLESLERLKNTLLAEGYWQDVLQDTLVIEKELRALKIINNKEILLVYKDYQETCYLVANGMAIEITQEEYDLLKEVLL